MSLPAIVWVFNHSDATLGARLVLLVLAEYAHDDGTDAFPSVDTIAARARMSRKGVQDCLRRLERDGMIEHTGTRDSGTRVYTILGMGAKNLRPEGGEETTRGGEDDGLGGAKMTASRGEAATPDPSRPNNRDPTTESLPLVWMACSPPLVAHRDSYFASPKVVSALKAARKVYPDDAIAEAIRNYATVLGGADYRWSYRWTFADFLRRGLDRFVAEAQPLLNFRSGPRLRAVGDDDFSDLPDIPDLGVAGEQETAAK